MVGAALSGLLIGLCTRGLLHGTVACIALVPVLLALSKPVTATRAGAMTLTAALGLLLAAYEGALHAIPWAFPVLLIMSAPAAILPGVLLSRLQRAAANGSIHRHFCLWSTPFTWVAAEFISGQRSIWGQFASPVSLAYTQFDAPLMSVAAVTGVTGVSFAVLAINVAVTQAVHARRLWPWGAIGLIALTGFGSSDAVDSVSGDPTTVAIVQPALSSEWYEVASEVAPARLAILDRLTAMSQEGAGADLIVLPEGALPVGGRSAIPTLRLAPREVGGPDMLAGGVISRRGEKFNSLLEVRDGGFDIVFDKLAPVPVGESGISPGRRLTVGNWGGVWSGLLICLDSLYPAFSRELARSGAQLLVVAADDSFAVRMATARLHLRASAFRAVETGLPLVFASAWGPSAVIAPSGRIIAQSDFGSRTVLQAGIPYPLPTTFYVRYGEYVGFIAVFVSAFLLLVSTIQRRRS